MITTSTRVDLHPLISRPDDDDPDLMVFGRAEIGEYVELPTVYGEALRLLGEGHPAGAVEKRIADEQGAEIDVAELVEAATGLGFIRAIDGEPVPDPATDAPRSHFPWLTARHVGWIFSLPMKVLWAATTVAALASLVMRPELVPTYEHFFWSDYVGLAVLVNTAMMSVAISAHEMMHLMAARSLGAPGRIGFGTRLYTLVVQTDVTGVWGVPRRRRYRAYLAGMTWDLFLMATIILLVAYVPMPSLVAALLQALLVTVLMTIPFQLQVYMRTDLYYVLRDLLRTSNLFDDGLAYAKYLRAKVWAAVRRRPPPAEDPTTGLDPHERRATRVYAVVLVVGGTFALGNYALFAIPIAIEAVLRAVDALAGSFTGGPILPAIDSGLLILVEGGIQVLFVITFIRTHPHWFGRISRRAGR